MLIFLAACTGQALSLPQPAQDLITAPDLASEVCNSISHTVLQRIYNGTDPHRSGDIQLIPTYPNFVSGGLTHASPYGYTEHVPLLLYGPGYIRSGTFSKPATLTDLPATTAALLKFHGFRAPDGHALTNALLPAPARPTPRLVVTMVWDGAGMDLLDRWPHAWPYFASLSHRGAWFTHVTVNASPTNTPPAHAEIGTGAYPRTNGIVDEYERIDDTMRSATEVGPTALRLPTLADIYDRARGNRPKVADLASLTTQLNMMGHGSAFPGGDQDIAITRKSRAPGDESGGSWKLSRAMAPHYTFPAYANSPATLTVFRDALQKLDRRDGRLDGKWRDHSIQQLLDGFDTPARSPYQTAMFEQVIEREHMGADAVPDLLFLNYKVMDALGHTFTADGVELSDALRAQDNTLRSFVRFLNRNVGKGKWVLMLAADHGMQRDPGVTGAFTIDVGKLTAAINAAFAGSDGQPVVQRARPTQIWMDTEQLAANGYSLTDVSRFIVGLEERTTASHGEGSQHPDATVFDAAFPSSVLQAMDCVRRSHPLG